MRGYVPGIPVSYPVTHPDSPKLLKGVFPSALAVQQIISRLSGFRGVCVARSVRRQTPGFSSDHDFAGRGIEPQDQLHAQRGVCLKIFSLCSSPTHASTCTHSLKYIPKSLKKKKQQLSGLKQQFIISHAPVGWLGSSGPQAVTVSGFQLGRLQAWLGARPKSCHQECVTLCILSSAWPGLGCPTRLPALVCAFSVLTGTSLPGLLSHMISPGG